MKLSHSHSMTHQKVQSTPLSVPVTLAHSASTRKMLSPPCFIWLNYHLAQVDPATPPMLQPGTLSTSLLTALNSLGLHTFPPQQSPSCKWQHHANKALYSRNINYQKLSVAPKTLREVCTLSTYQRHRPAIAST